MTTNNPLTSHSAIADKFARRLYRDIDGHKNVQELCDITHLGMKEVRKALRALLDERRIELLDSTGQLEDVSLLLNDL